MVAGGYDWDWYILSSVEIYDGNAWKILAGNLPTALMSLNLITFKNRIFLFGRSWSSTHTISLFGSDKEP